MKRFFVSFFIAGFVLIFSIGSYAASSSFGIKAGTLGVGPELEHSFNKSLGARIGFNYFSLTKSASEGNIDYNLKAKLRNFAALFDWHPFKGTFRISAGVLYNKNEFEGNGKSSGPLSSQTFKIGNKTYSINDIKSVHGKIEYRNFNPYLSLGWDTSAGKTNGLGFTFELGAVYQGKSKVTLTAAGNSTTINSQIFKDNLSLETNNVKRNANKLKVWPVISLGLVYRF